jgi:mRNA interferase MazF
MVIPQRGDVWWASLEAPHGSSPGYRRPVLVVQSNSFNASAIQTVIVAAITSNLSVADAPGNVRLPKATAGLRRPSVVNVSQVLSVDRSFLQERLGVLSSRQMNAVAEGLRLVLAL